MKYKEQLDFMSQLNAAELIIDSFSKKQLKDAINKLNELIFQKRCAPQREIECFKLIDDKYHLYCKIITEYRIELYVFYGSFDLPCHLKDLQSASNRAGNTVKIEFNE